MSAADDRDRPDVRWYFSPPALLAAQTAAVVLVAASLGLGRVCMTADSSSYVETSRMPWRDALLSIRTVGYPLFLKVVAWFSPEYGAVPWLHFAALAGCVFFFDLALRRFGASPWGACAVSSGFLYAALPLRSPVASLLTDFLAVVAAVAAVACLFWLAARRRQPLAWIGLLLAVAAAYHIRPAYLFLVPLAPCLGVWFSRLHCRSIGGRFVWRGFLAALVLVCFVPLLLYCSLRLAVVGNFGLVSFGGYNLSGLACELLDQDLVEHELPERYRDMGRQILEERSRRDMKSAFQGRRYVSMRTYEDNFCTSIYQIAVPAAERLFGEDPLERDRALTDFSRQVIGLRKGKAALWALYLYIRAALKIIAFTWVLWILMPAAVIVEAVYRRFARSVPQDLVLPDDAGDRRTLLALGGLTALFFTAAVALLCLSGTYGDSRLVVPTGIFAAPLLALLVLRRAAAVCLLRQAALTRKGTPCCGS
jgi:hypothetical protein